MKEWMTDELAWSIRETITHLNKAVKKFDESLNECALIEKFVIDVNRNEIKNEETELNNYKEQIKSISSILYEMIDENIFDVLQA
jgi:hypothetical protein